MTYKGGEKTIVVPPDVPIVGIVLGSRGLFTVGAHVAASGGGNADDGSLDAVSVTVGFNGLVPAT